MSLFILSVVVLQFLIIMLCFATLGPEVAGCMFDASTSVFSNFFSEAYFFPKSTSTVPAQNDKFSSSRGSFLRMHSHPFQPICP